MASASDIPVIDLFSGPGGLSEGFSRFGDRRWDTELSRVVTGASAARDEGGKSAAGFRIALSIEKDHHARSTLRLRAFFRTFGPGQGGRVPAEYHEHLRGDRSSMDLFSKFPSEAELSANEAWLGALGENGIPPEDVDHRIRAALRKHGRGREAARGPWVLIGGPPC